MAAVTLAIGKGCHLLLLAIKNLVVILLMLLKKKSKVVCMHPSKIKKKEIFRKACLINDLWNYKDILNHINIKKNVNMTINKIEIEIKQTIYSSF